MEIMIWSRINGTLNRMKKGSGDGSGNTEAHNQELPIGGGTSTGRTMTGKKPRMLSTKES